jgi:hypothetical protein
MSLPEFEPRIAQSISDWLRSGPPRDWSSSPIMVKNFLRVVQTGSGAPPASYAMGTGGNASRA